MKAVRLPQPATHRHTAPGQHEHEFEPQYGLPELLPSDEQLIWQTSPNWKVLALRRFHLRKLAVYFAVLWIARLSSLANDGAGPIEMLRGSALLASLSLLCIALFAFIAWLTARTTVYTLTSKRVVMRIGIVLTVTLNLPLRKIASAGLDAHTGQNGDIALQLLGPDRIAFLQLWPHARRWRFSQPEPTLLCLEDAPMLAGQLTQAWSAATGEAARPAHAAEPQARPGLSPQSPSLAAQ